MGGAQSVHFRDGIHLDLLPAAIATVGALPDASHQIQMVAGSAEGGLPVRQNSRIPREFPAEMDLRGPATIWIWSSGGRPLKDFRPFPVTAQLAQQSRTGSWDESRRRLSSFISSDLTCTAPIIRSFRSRVTAFAKPRADLAVQPSERESSTQPSRRRRARRPSRRTILDLRRSIPPTGWPSRATEAATAQRP
jgi:hypothetical protein